MSKSCSLSEAIQVGYEAIGLWCRKFGPQLARELRPRHPRRGEKWYLDEVALSMNKRPYWLWRAADQDRTVSGHPGAESTRPAGVMMLRACLRALS